MFKFFKDSGELYDEAYNIEPTSFDGHVRAALFNLKTNELIGFIRGDRESVIQKAKEEQRAIIEWEDF